MLHITGINHKKTPVSIREKLTFSKDQVPLFINFLIDDNIIRNMVLISTCNRTEVYYTREESCSGKIKKYITDKILQFKKLETMCSDYFYHYSGTSAVEHLFRVSSGLDSLVLGENQILGQIKDAYRMSVEIGCTDTILNKVFHKAFETGKKIRNETGINKGASSIGYAAVELALKIFDTLYGRSVLLVGLGETGMLVLKSLAARGSSSIYISNRTHEKAVLVSKEYNAQPVPFTMLKNYAEICDIIITSTSSPTCLFEKKDIQNIIRKRRNRYLFIIDLSVPRDVEEDVGKLNNVFLYNIDSLQAVVAHNYNKRKNEIKKAEFIIQQELKIMLQWFATLRLGPTIKRLKECVESIGKKKLEEVKNHVSDNEYECVKEVVQSINKKYFNLIITNLKEYSHNGKHMEYINIVNKLFGL